MYWIWTLKLTNFSNIRLKIKTKPRGRQVRIPESQGWVASCCFFLSYLPGKFGLNLLTNKTGSFGHRFNLIGSCNKNTRKSILMSIPDITLLPFPGCLLVCFLLLFFESIFPSKLRCILTWFNANDALFHFLRKHSLFS